MTCTRSRAQAIISVMMLVVVCAACAPAAPSRSDTEGNAGAPSQSGADTRRTQQQRTLVTVVRVEPVSLASRPVTATGAGVGFITRVFNAGLDIVDARDQPHPYLAEALPHLNTETWQ